MAQGQFLTKINTTSYWSYESKQHTNTLQSKQTKQTKEPSIQRTLHPFCSLIYNETIGVYKQMKSQLIGACGIYCHTSFKEKRIKKIISFVQPYAKFDVNVYGIFFHMSTKYHWK